jgi:hypothetical protein
MNNERDDLENHSKKEDLNEPVIKKEGIIPISNKNFFSKYSTAVSIFISAVITISGWIVNDNMNMKEARKSKFVEIKNEYLLNAYRDIYTYSILKRYNLLTKKIVLDYFRAIGDIQVYGTRHEITTLFDVVSDTSYYEIDTVLNLLRNNIRKDFSLPESKSGVFWVLDLSPFTNEGKVLKLSPGQTIEAGIPLKDDKKFFFLNHGEVPLTIFAGGDKPIVPENPFILPAGEEAEKSVTELGAPGSRYLYILNANPDLSGAVEIIEVTGE